MAGIGRFVLLGDYGAGKSMTLRQMFRRFRDDYVQSRSPRFPVYINLRDHFGQTNPAEVLERHARHIGFSNPTHLVRAWRSGFVILLIDGFDEVATIGIQGIWRRLQDSRYRAMEAVRCLLREQPLGAGLILAGRAHFFDSERERRNALGLTERYVQLSLNEFTSEKFMFERTVTIQYPEEKRPVRPRFRGLRVLKRYENGLEKCIGCSLCAAACPADAIFVEASENTDEKRFSPGERYASTYEINMLRCIYCGFCEDACPTEAIVLGDNYELSFTDRREAIYDKSMLLEPVPAQEMLTPRKVEMGVYTRSVPEMKDPRD